MPLLAQSVRPSEIDGGHGHIHQVPCSYDMAVNALNRFYPGYREAVEATFEAAKRRAEINGPLRGGGTPVYTIPVVVHVVWNDTSENIPQSQIDDQIAVLNEDYRRLNADAANLRSIFLPVAGDAHIEFQLVQVERVQTNAVFAPTLANPTIDQVKQTAQGGSDAWDPAEYLNLWVCNIRPLVIFGTESPIFGYAYPPANLANWPAGSQAPSPNLEGVVIDYRAFGRNMTYTIAGPNGPMMLPIEGRTATHEVGHYLGLRHIWGDGTLAQFGIPDCAASDGVDDTPFSGVPSNFECDTTKNNCQDTPVDYPDLVENYMDYSSETCMIMFTQGQVGLMRAVLEGPRFSLIDGAVGLNPAPAAGDLRIFPNPAEEMASLVPPAGHTGAYTVHLVNSLGQTALSLSGNGDSPIALDLGGLPAGLYLAVWQSEGLRSTAKLTVAP
jgi:hypothetical protein